MQKMNSTLWRPAITVLGGLVAFRLVPSVGEWIFCLLLLWDGKTAVRDGDDVVVSYFKLVGGLNSCSNKSAGCGGFFDKEKIEEHGG